MNSRKTNQPWLDHRGRELPTEQLREVSKTWDKRSWTRYADSLEVQPQGKSLKHGEFRKLEEQQTKSIFAVHSENSASEPLTRRVNQALECLSPRQRQVIDLVFYQGKSVEACALELGLSKPTVHEHKKQAFAKLKGVLSVSPNAVAAYEGVSDLETDPNTPFEDLLEVINADICRTDSSRHDFDMGDSE